MKITAYSEIIGITENEKWKFRAEYQVDQKEKATIKIYHNGHGEITPLQVCFRDLDSLIDGLIHFRQVLQENTET